MNVFPLPLVELYGQWGAYFVYFLIGVAFGWVLEMAGFANSRKLAAQFYFRDMTVLKVMFTAIVVAMVLIFLATALGLLDYNLVWVNPTYLWPGIVGGLIMGVGFIVGGFCPGTSLVAAATLKIDGFFFVAGVLFGIFVFGETVGSFYDFFHSSYMGRFTLPELFGVSTGATVAGVVVMALGMFWGAEKLEAIFGARRTGATRMPRWRFGAAAVTVGLVGAVIVLGQPTAEDRWRAVREEKVLLLATRQVQIDPGELLASLANRARRTVLLDVRDESDFNRFHLPDARNVPLAKLPEAIAELHLEPANTVFVTMSNDERAATEAWKRLQAESVPNVYILAGGINGWIERFAQPDFRNVSRKLSPADDMLAFDFRAALGDRHEMADPNPEHSAFRYLPLIKLEEKRAATSGGCF